ncbi:MAG: hypothetical protein H0S79_07570 [Anaerolineaceae bacterium]|nr:hypothetical protein [Anaerolineaceae bacterium]
MNNLFSKNGNPHSHVGDENQITKDELLENRLTELDAQLAAAGEAVKVPPDFQAKLQTKLYIAANRPTPKPHKNQARRSRYIGWAAIGLAAVALALVFLLPALKPDKPDNEIAQPEGNTTEVAEQPTETVAAEPPTDQSPIEKLLISFFGSTAQAQGGGSGSFGSEELTLTAAFPESPSEAVVYEQVVEDVTSAEQAKAFASQLGIEGEVFLIPYEGGGFSYVVTDGIQEVTIINSTTYFVYLADFGVGISSSAAPLPLSERVEIAETFLQEHGLLDFEYQMDETLSQDNRVVFTRILNDYPLLITDTYNPFIEVRINSTGEIAFLIYRLNKVNAIGNYPLRTAQEAWNLVLENPNDQRVQYTIEPPEMSYRTVLPAWQRSYAIGQKIDLYSYLSLYKSAEANTEDWVTAGEFTLEGDLEGLIEAYNNPPELTAEQLEKISEGIISEKHAIGWNRFFHVWGQSRQDENGARYLTVEGWEVSPMPDETLYGEFKSVNQQIVFVDEDNQQWEIPALPDNTPMDTWVTVRGVRDNTQVNLFLWNMIQVEPVEDPFSQGGGGGGGDSGGGPMEFSPDPEATPEPTPEPLPMPYEVGEQIDGLVGTLTMQRIVRSDGSKVTEAYLGGYLPDDPERYQSYQLLDEDLSTLEGLNLLHLRVWGTFTLTENGLAAIQLEKAEKAYKEEEVQAWLGHHQVIELDGQLVLQFTDSLTGQQYILSRSLDMPAEYLTDPFNGAQCIIEGVLSQDTYAGLPMITDFSGSIALGVTDLSDYVIYSTQIYDQPEMPTTFTDQVTDGINIDSIQLVYFAYDLTQGGGGLAISESPVRFVQPVWWFSGTLSNGQIIEILVQAVTDAYLH